MSTNHTSENNQRICSQLVSREVGHCVSSLISHCAENPEAINGSGYDYEDVLNLCRNQDFESAFTDSGYEVRQSSDGTDYLGQFDKSLDDFEDETDEDGNTTTAQEQYDEYLSDNAEESVYIESVGDLDAEDPDYEAICRKLGIEDDADREVYEHWIVSDWFARRLAEHGETTGELFGLTIWGRTCTGQAIHLDGVIGEIAAEMEILEGQANDWSK